MRVVGRDRQLGCGLDGHKEVRRYNPSDKAPVWLTRLFSSPLVLAASIGDMLKLTGEKFTAGTDKFAPFDLLVVDEASMMHFGHALAVVLRLLRPGGRLVLAGDHRQLPAISKYDFENDLRPSVVLHRAHVSAYDYAWALGQSGEIFLEPGVCLVTHAASKQPSPPPSPSPTPNAQHPLHPPRLPPRGAHPARLQLALRGL